MKNRNAAATWLKGLRVFFNQVYFKASAADGSWTTYFKSFVPEGWYVFGATVAVTMSGRSFWILTNPFSDKLKWL